MGSNPSSLEFKSQLDLLQWTSILGTSLQIIGEGNINHLQSINFIFLLSFFKGWCLGVFLTLYILIKLDENHLQWGVFQLLTEKKEKLEKPETKLSAAQKVYIRETKTKACSFQKNHWIMSCWKRENNCMIQMLQIHMVCLKHQRGHVKRYLRICVSCLRSI